MTDTAWPSCHRADFRTFAITQDAKIVVGDAHGAWENLLLEWRWNARECATQQPARASLPHVSSSEVLEVNLCAVEDGGTDVLQVCTVGPR